MDFVDGIEFEDNLVQHHWPAIGHAQPFTKPPLCTHHFPVICSLLLDSNYLGETIDACKYGI
jgi:hypothetical protein